VNMSSSSRVIALIVATLVLNACVTVSDTSQTKADPVQASLANTNLGREYMQDGKNELALAKLQRAIELNPENGSAHTLLGILYERLGQPDKAERYYRRAVSVAGTDGDSLNNYAVFLCKSGRMKESERYFRRAANSAGYRTPAAALTNAGVCARKRGDASAAEEHLRLALRWDDEFGLALYHLADLNYETGNALTARAFLERYTARHKVDATVLWLGVRIEKNLGDEVAMAAYANALRSQYPRSQEAAELSRLEF